MLHSLSDNIDLLETVPISNNNNNRTTIDPLTLNEVRNEQIYNEESLS